MWLFTFDVEDPWTAAQLGQQVGEEVSRFQHVDLPRNPNGFWQRIERSYENVFEHRALIAEGRAAANSESMRESLAGATANEQNYLDLGYSESVAETRIAEWMVPFVISAAPPVIGVAAAAAKAYGWANKSGFFKTNYSWSAESFIETPYGKTLQSESRLALEARRQIELGAWLYRGGKLGRSAGPEGQFWSLENPLNSGYAEKYGIPVENTKFDFIEVAVLKPGSTFITREAPGIGINSGGGIEVIVNAGEPKLQYFHMPWGPEYDSVEQRFIPKY